MVNRRASLSIWAAVLAAVTVISGCSSTKKVSNSNPTSPPSTASAQGASSGAAPIKIGSICVCSGALGSRALPGEQAIEAWSKAINAAGGINGHPIDLIVKDDGGNPGTSLAAAQSLISSHVAAILDNTSLDQTWQKQVDAAKIPVIGGTTGTLPYFQDPNWYPTGQTNDSATYSTVATAKVAIGTSPKKIGMLYCAEAPECAQSISFTKAAATQLGLSLVYTGSISATAPNYTAQCVAAKQAGAQALIILDVTQVFINVAQNCAQQNYKPAFVAEGTGYSDQILGSSALANSYWAPFGDLPYFASSPAVAAMDAAVNKYEPGLRQKATAWSQIASEAWVAALALETALKAAHVPANSTATSADVTRGLETFSNETLQGWAPPLTFAPNKPHPVDCWYTGNVKNGKPGLVDGTKLSCQSSST